MLLALVISSVNIIFVINITPFGTHQIQRRYFLFFFISLRDNSNDLVTRFKGFQFCSLLQMIDLFLIFLTTYMFAWGLILIIGTQLCFLLMATYILGSNTLWRVVVLYLLVLYFCRSIGIYSLQLLNMLVIP